MNFTMDSISRMVRMGGLAATLALSVGLTGCDNDDGEGGGGGGGGAAAADLSTVEGAQAQVGNLAQILQAMDMVTALPGGPATASTRGGVSAKAVGAAVDECESGGSVSDTGPTTKNVNSPFTAQQISVSGVRYDDCKHEVSDSGSTLSFTIDGSSEHGSVTDAANEVSYLRVGESRSNPLAFDYEVSSQGSDIAIELGLYLRDDYRESATDEEGEFVFNIDGDYIVNAAGQRVKSGFRYYMGTTDEPFVSMEDAEGLVISGKYGFTFSGQMFDAIPGCVKGGVTVATDEPLVESESSASPFTAGKLTLSAGGDSASVTFNDDNTVTVKVGSQEETVAYSELLAGAAPCANLGLAGLYLASGFAR